MLTADRLKQETTATGTGNLALGAAPVGFRNIDSVFGASQRFVYVVQNMATGEWELGWGYVSAGSLVRETPLEGSAATPISFGAGTKQVFVAHSAMLSNAMTMALFGGALADSVVTGGATLGEDGHYGTLSISGAGSLNGGGKRVKARVLDLRTAGNSAIHNNGTDGSSAVGTTGFPGGKGGDYGTLGSGTSGGNGANGGTAAGAQGTAAAALSNGNGGNGGAGGVGGDGSGGAGGASKSTGQVSGKQTPGMFDPLMGDNAGTGITILGGGTGGAGGSSGGGDGTAGGGGGGGGGGAGVLDIAAGVLLVHPSNTAAAAISARGGAGGQGDVPAAGNRGGGAGGGGGGGGYIRLIVGYVIGSKTQLCSAGGGNAGHGATGTGTGTAGGGGTGGAGGRIDIWNLSLGTFQHVLGTSGVAPNAQSGGAGGTAYGDV